jgi:hypothetical protein
VSIRRVLTSIEISLQNHLSRYLVHIVAGGTRFLAGFTQRPVRRDRC